MSDSEQNTRDRAYKIWLEEGQPKGKALEHWQRAERELSILMPKNMLEDRGEGQAPAAPVSPDDLKR